MNPLFERYVVALEQKGRDPKTIRQNVQAFRHLDSYFVAWRIDPAKATDEDLSTFFAAQQARYAYNTCNGRLKVVRAFYGWATRTKQVHHDPTREVGLGRPDQIEPEIFSNEELRLMYAACQDERERLMFMLLAYTGLRKEEMLTLKWDDLDWDKSELKVVGKFKKFRRVPIHPLLSEALAEADARKRYGQRYVVESNRKDRISQANAHLLWSNVRARAGLEDKRQLFHGIRKTVNTILYEQGVREDVIDKIMGWAPVSVRQKFYTRIADTATHEAILLLYRNDPIHETVKPQLERRLSRELPQIVEPVAPPRKLSRDTATHNSDAVVDESGAVANSILKKVSLKLRRLAAAS